MESSFGTGSSDEKRKGGGKKKENSHDATSKKSGAGVRRGDGQATTRCLCRKEGEEKKKGNGSLAV